MSKGKILIVEDEADIRTMLALDFKDAGFEIMQAADGEAAFSLAQKSKPDLLITDVLLPKVNGNELIKKLRATDWGEDILFVVLTGRGLMKDYFEVIHVDAFFDKPFVTEELIKKVNDLLAAKKKKKEEDAHIQIDSVQPKTEEPITDTKASGAKDKRKYCDTCDRHIALTSTVCPHCGNFHLKTVST